MPNTDKLDERNESITSNESPTDSITLNSANKLFYTEQEVAAMLDKSLSFLRTLRAGGKIGYTRCGKTPVFLEKHIRQYLEANECPATHDFESENIGYRKEKVVQIGTQRHLIQKRGRQSEHLSALQILKKRNKD